MNSQTESLSVPSTKILSFLCNQIKESCINIPTISGKSLTFENPNYGNHFSLIMPEIQNTILKMKRGRIYHFSTSWRKIVLYIVLPTGGLTSSSFSLKNTKSKMEKQTRHRRKKGNTIF